MIFYKKSNQYLNQALTTENYLSEYSDRISSAKYQTQRELDNYHNFQRDLNKIK